MLATSLPERPVRGGGFGIPPRAGLGLLSGEGGRDEALTRLSSSSFALSGGRTSPAEEENAAREERSGLAEQPCPPQARLPWEAATERKSRPVRDCRRAARKRDELEPKRDARRENRGEGGKGGNKRSSRDAPGVRRVLQHRRKTRESPKKKKNPPAGRKETRMHRM